MADYPVVDSKGQLSAELARMRIAMSRTWTGMKRNASVTRNVKGSFNQNRTAWLGGAAVFGWILSRLPARKKQVKVYVESGEKRVKIVKQAGLLLGLARILVPLLKPTVMAYVTAKIAEASARKGKFDTGRK